MINIADIFFAEGGSQGGGQALSPGNPTLKQVPWQK
jgi:hypothetical protein